MKIGRLPGDCAFRALYKTIDGWKLTDTYFFNPKEVLGNPDWQQVVWPVEIFEDGSLYVPDQSELE